jgi:hypothetical protein
VAADLQAQAEQQARQSVSVELEDLKRQAADKDAKLRAAQQAELQLRKQKRDLEERERLLELDTARKLDEERRKIEDQAVRQVEERHRLKDAEKDKQLHDALAANEELRRKLQQGLATDPRRGAGTGARRTASRTRFRSTASSRCQKA